MLASVAGMTEPVQVFADIGCPFAYVGIRRLIAARDAAGSARRVRVRAWPLELINGAPLDPKHVAREVEDLQAQVTPQLFAGFDPATFPRTSIPAFGLAAVAYDKDDATGEAVSVAIREALFERGARVDDRTVLTEIGVAHSVAIPDLSDASAAARRDWGLGTQLGVKGSPHFFAAHDDWFCPTLVIEHADEHYHIHDAAGMEAFFAAALS